MANSVGVQVLAGTHTCGIQGGTCGTKAGPGWEASLQQLAQHLSLLRGDLGSVREDRGVGTAVSIREPQDSPLLVGGQDAEDRVKPIKAPRILHVVKALPKNVLVCIA